MEASSSQLPVAMSPIHMEPVMQIRKIMAPIMVLRLAAVPIMMDSLLVPILEEKILLSKQTIISSKQMVALLR